VSRHRGLKVALAVLAGGGVAGAAAWVVFASPVLGVSRVVISGNAGVSSVDIRRAARVPDGEPLATVDLNAVRARIAARPPIEWARVERDWPGTLRVRVRERRPIAVAPVGGKTALVDRYGVVIELRDSAPPRLPLLRVARLATDDPATRAALAVIRGLPARLSRQVEEVHAASPTTVSLSLADGRTVMWGGAERTGPKARILQTLLAGPGQSYDVSSPDVAAVK
jgi:cell division protein FtsQ